MTPRIICLPHPMLGFGICIGGRFDGWLMWQHPDGQWVSREKLPVSDPAVSAPDAAQTEAARAFTKIRELNMTGADENGHRWANSDLIDQTVTQGLISLRALDAAKAHPAAPAPGIAEAAKVLLNSPAALKILVDFQLRYSASITVKARSMRHKKIVAALRAITNGESHD